MAASFGAFGKISGLGDFFRFGLPRDFVQVWDAWLQNGLSNAQTRFGEGWVDTYNTAPIWRFLLTPGQAGAQAVIGVLMPSVDRVGRRFPLTLAAAVPADVPLLALYFHSEALFARLEDIALATLNDPGEPKQLEAALAGLVLPITEKAEERTLKGRLLLQRAGQNNAVADLAASMAGPVTNGLALWSTCAVDTSQAFVMHGAPDSELFLHLMNPFMKSEVRA